MALDYDGANSKAQNDTATGFTASVWTFLAWLNIDTAGENATGRIFTTDETSTGGITIRTISTTAIRFSQARATTVGIWDYAFTTGQWFALMVSYDTSSVSNIPVFGKMILGTDKSLQSITAALNSTPVGAITSTASGYCIGNRADQLVTFDGRIHRPRFYNRILTLDEATEELWRPGTVTSGLVIHIDDKGVDRSGNGWNATLTSTTLADPPPDIPLEFGFDDYEPYAGATAATPASVSSRRGKPLIHPGRHPDKFGRHLRTKRNNVASSVSPLTGSSSSTTTATATLTGAGALSGSASGLASTSATLSSTGALTGSSSAVASTTATLAGAGELIGSSYGVATASATGFITVLEGSRRLKQANHPGKGPYNFAKFRRTRRNTFAELTLTGVASAVASASGTLSGAGALSGSASGTATSTATLAGAGDLSGSASGLATTSATLAGSGALTGSASAVGSASATLSGSGALSASSSSVATASGTVAGAGALTGSASAVASASGTIYDYAISGPLTGSASATSSATGTLSGAGTLSGSASGVASVSGTLSGSGALSGSSSGVASAVAVLSGLAYLTGSTSALTTATGLLAGLGALSGASNAQSAATGLLWGLGGLSGLASASGSASASFPADNVANLVDSIVVSENKLYTLSLKANKLLQVKVKPC